MVFAPCLYGATSPHSAPWQALAGPSSLAMPATYLRRANLSPNSPPSFFLSSQRTHAVFDCGTVSQAAGSGYAEFGGTKVLAAVYGPRQPERRSTSLDRGELDCDVRLASFAGRARKVPGQTDGERELSAQLSTALAGVVLLDRFPKAVLDVQCLVMEAGGGELAATVAAAGLALADAGVAIRDLPSAAAVVRDAGSGTGRKAGFSLCTHVPAPVHVHGSGGDCGKEADAAARLGTGRWRRGLLLAGPAAAAPSSRLACLAL